MKRNPVNFDRTATILRDEWVSRRCESSGKVKYRSRKIAAQEGASVERIYGYGPFTAYKCRSCRCWHLATVKTP